MAPPQTHGPRAARETGPTWVYLACWEPQPGFERQLVVKSFGRRRHQSRTIATKTKSSMKALSGLRSRTDFPGGPPSNLQRLPIEVPSISGLDQDAPQGRPHLDRSLGTKSPSRTRELWIGLLQRIPADMHDTLREAWRFVQMMARMKRKVHVWL